MKTLAVTIVLILLSFAAYATGTETRGNKVKKNVPGVTTHMGVDAGSHVELQCLRELEFTIRCKRRLINDLNAESEPFVVPGGKAIVITDVLMRGCGDAEQCGGTTLFATLEGLGKPLADFTSPPFERNSESLVGGWVFGSGFGFFVLGDAIEVTILGYLVPNRPRPAH